MKTKNLVLPSLGLGLALLFVAPADESAATFSLTGSSLGQNQRDFRVFNNFADSASNNNSSPDPMFPGALGAELAIWKGVVEWGSGPHGDGSGDPVNGNVLGSGGANFDALWGGNANNVGNADQNVISAQNGGSNCSSGTLAYALLPSSNGWQIRFCDNNAVFADGPAGIGGATFDMQGILAHEYGHVLGLGHSCNNAATMRPAGAPGQTALRSIHADDIAGVQQIYGVASSSKPGICLTSVSGNTLTITGANFDAFNNEVWFTNKNTTGVSVDPRVRVFNVPSTNDGTQLSVTIPNAAGPGDVMVKVPGTGFATMSNAFPTDLAGTISALGNCPLTLSSVTPSEIEALIPGTEETVTLKGTGFSNVTDVLFNLFTSIDSSDWTIVDDATITVNMPQAPLLGAAILSVVSPSAQRDIGITIVEVSSPKLELGTGDAFNVNPNGSNMNVVVAGKPGTTHRIYYSPSPIPSSHPVAMFDMGNNFSQFFFATALNIGNKGYTQTSAPIVYNMAAMDFYCQSIDLSTAPNPQYGISNLQTIRLTP